MLAVATVKQTQEMQGTTGQVKLPQASGGPKTPVIMGKGAIDKVVKENQTVFPVEMFHEIQSEQGKSNKSLLGLARIIRKHGGRKLITQCTLL